jgi:hypothetical protein
MTPPERDYDDILSRILHSTVDPIEPTGDGLAKIQRRIAEPWLKRQMSLIRYELGALGWLILVRCEPLFGAVKSSIAPGGGSSRHERARTRGWLGPAMAWLRPALAVAGAVIIVVAGVFAMGQIRENLVGTGASASGGAGGHPIAVTGGGSGNAAQGHRTGKNGRFTYPGGPYQSKHGGRASGQSGSSHYSPSPSTGCGTPTPAPSPSVSATPTPTPTPTPTVTPTPTPSPSPTSSGAGGTPPPSGSPPPPTPTSAASADAFVITVGGHGRTIGRVSPGSCGNTGLSPGYPGLPGV